MSLQLTVGDRAFLTRCDDEAEARAWASAVRGARWSGVVDVVLAYATVAVFADPDRVDLDDLERRLRALVTRPQDQAPGPIHDIPVWYDGEDLEAVARQSGLDPGEVVALHSGTVYDVRAVGFLPGFPYAGDLPAPLRGLPRRGAPRVRVPAGAVALAGRQTGIYPQDSPGGWHLLGRTPLRIADVARAHFPIRAGDRLRFHPIDSVTFAARRGELLGAHAGYRDGDLNLAPGCRRLSSTLAV